MKSAIETLNSQQILQHALNWWESVQMLDAASNGRGMRFGENYTPTWVIQARDNLIAAGQPTQESPKDPRTSGSGRTA